MVGHPIDSEVGIMISEQQFGQLQAKVDATEKSVEKIWKILDGNGKSGLRETATRIDERLVDLTEDVKANAVSLQEVPGSLDAIAAHVNETNRHIGEIKSLLEKHAADQNLHSPKGLLLRKEILIAIAGFLSTGFVVSSLWTITLIRLIPDEFGLWNIIEMILGI